MYSKQGKTETLARTGLGAAFYNVLPQRSLTKLAIKRLTSSLKGANSTVPKEHESNEGAGGSTTTKSSFSSLTKRKTDKRVTFLEVAGVLIIPGRDDLSAEEQALTWYQRREYHAMSAESRVLLLQLKRGEITECPRGLERHAMKMEVDGERRFQQESKLAVLQQKGGGLSAISVVLIEQHRQVKEGVVNEDYIAFLYHSASSGSRLFSNKIALEDQEAAKLTYLEGGTSNATIKQVLALFGGGRVNTMRKTTRNNQGACAA